MAIATAALPALSAGQPPTTEPQPGAQPPAHASSVPVPDARLTRMLERLTAANSSPLRDLNLSSYVVVVGRAPSTSLFGRDPNLGVAGAGRGMPTHAEMMSVARSPEARQAAGADGLGIATATAFSALVPTAVKAVASWLAGPSDPGPESPRYAGYTRHLRLSSGPPGSRITSTVAFHRGPGQPVAVSMRVDASFDGVIRIAVDGKPLGEFDGAIEDLEVADAIFDQDRTGDVHVLTLEAESHSALEKPANVHVLVVVHATSCG